MNSALSRRATVVVVLDAHALGAGIGAAVGFTSQNLLMGPSLAASSSSCSADSLMMHHAVNRRGGTEGYGWA